jgi:hypothetical protein
MRFALPNVQVGILGKVPTERTSKEPFLFLELGWAMG